MHFIEQKRWKKLAGIKESSSYVYEQEEFSNKIPEYLAYAVALAKKFGHISPGQVMYVANKQENVKNSKFAIYDVIDEIENSNMFDREFNKEFGITTYTLKEKLEEVKDEYLGDREIWDTKEDYYLDTPEKDELDNNDSTPKQFGMKKSSLVLKENIDLVATMSGLLTSGVLTAMIFSKGHGAISYLGNLFNHFIDNVEDLERNVAQEDQNYHMEILNKSKEISNKLANDMKFKAILRELNKFTSPENVNKIDEYDKSRIKYLNKLLEEHLNKVLDSKDKNNIKEVIKLMSGS